MSDQVTNNILQPNLNFNKTIISKIIFKELLKKIYSDDSKSNESLKAITEQLFKGDLERDLDSLNETSIYHNIKVIKTLQYFLSENDINLYRNILELCCELGENFCCKNPKYLALSQAFKNVIPIIKQSMKKLEYLDSHYVNKLLTLSETMIASPTSNLSKSILDVSNNPHPPSNTITIIVKTLLFCGVSFSLHYLLGSLHQEQENENKIDERPINTNISLDDEQLKMLQWPDIVPEEKGNEDNSLSSDDVFDVCSSSGDSDTLPHDLPLKINKNAFTLKRRRTLSAYCETKRCKINDSRRSKTP